MSLSQSLNAKKVDLAVVQGLAQSVSSRIRTVCSPERLILFGSAAAGQFREGSDLDFLLVFSTTDLMKAARKAIRSLGLLDKNTPIDLIFVSKQLFDSKKDLGGVCFVAEHEGIDL